MEILDTIKAWAKAHRAVADNPERILRDGSGAAVLEQCAAGMRALNDAEDVMLALAGTPDLPAPLAEYIEAIHDSGCIQCWFSSRRPIHPDCGVKIDRFFQAVTALIHFAER